MSFLFISILWSLSILSISIYFSLISWWKSIILEGRQQPLVPLTICTLQLIPSSGLNPPLQSIYGAHISALHPICLPSVNPELTCSEAVRGSRLYTIAQQLRIWSHDMAKGAGIPHWQLSCSVLSVSLGTLKSFSLLSLLAVRDGSLHYGYRTLIMGNSQSSGCKCFGTRRQGRLVPQLER